MKNNSFIYSYFWSNFITSQEKNVFGKDKKLWKNGKKCMCKYNALEKKNIFGMLYSGTYDEA